MSRLVDQDDERAYRLAAAMIHVEECGKWKRSGKNGPPATQDAIRTRLIASLGRNLSQATVSRWLNKGEGIYWQREVKLIQNGIDRAVLGHAQNIVFQANLAARIRATLSRDCARRLLSVYAVTERRTGTRADTSDDAHMAFASGAASRLAELLSGGGHWGITWGRNVGAVVSRVVNDPENRLSIEKRPKFVPLCGDPFADLPTRESSSVLAEQMEVFFNAHPREFLSLRNVPAYLPERSAGFKPSEIEGIKKMMFSCKAYPAIFGTDRFATASKPRAQFDGTPIAERLDGILTSLSSKGKTFGYGAWSMIPVSDREKSWLNDNAFDIGGVCLAHSPVDEKGTALLNRIRTRWTGITFDQLDRCAERACRNPDANSPPGVVAVAFEDDKTYTIAACLRLGLISHLICTGKIADEVENRLREDPRS